MMICLLSSHLISTVQWKHPQNIAVLFGHLKDTAPQGMKGTSEDDSGRAKDIFHSKGVVKGLGVCF